MSKKILLVEDEALIAMTEKMQLEKYGYTVHHVTTGEKAVQTITDNTHPVDLILMDINLGSGIDGTQAAEQILNHKDIPVVFLSSHTDPEVAEKTEKITSYGYVVKNSGIVVLDASIKMALKLFEAKNKEKVHDEALRESHDLFEAIFESLDEAIFLVVPSTRKIIKCNDATTKIFGYSQKELASCVTDILHVDQEHFEQFGHEALVAYENPGYFKTEFNMKRKDGTVFPSEIFVRPLYDKDGEISYVVSRVRDITERKRAEKQLQAEKHNLRLTLNSIGDAVISTDNKGRIVRMNPVAERLCGWKEAEAFEKELNKVFHIIHADTRDIVDNPVGKVLENGEIVGLANHTMLISRNGQEYQITDSAAPIKDDEGNINGVVLVFRDVTGQYEKERQIKKNASLFEETQKLAHIGSWELDLATYQLSWSDEIYRIFGLQPQEFGATYNAFLESVHPEDRSKVDEAYTDSIKQNRDGYSIDHRIVRKDTGEIRYVHEKCMHARDEHGTIVRSIGMVQDITKQRNTDEALRNSKNKYKRLVNNSPNMIMETDVETHEIISCNPAMAMNLGFSITYIVGKEIEEFIPSDILQKRIEVSERAVETGEPQVLEDERNGKCFYTTYIPIVSEERRSIQTITIDVTERKKSENLLKEYANRLELTMEAANMAWWEMDINSGNVRFNKKKAEMLGYSSDQFHHYEDFTKLVHPDDYEPMMTSMSALLKGTEQKYDIEYRIKTHSGQYRWFHDLGTITDRSEDGAPGKVAGIVLDITSRKRAEIKLAESEALLDATSFLAHVGGWQLDVETMTITWTKETYRIHDVALDYKPSLDVAIKFFHPDDRITLSQAIQQALDKGESYDLELRFITAKGNDRWTRTMCQPEVVDGKTVRLRGTFQDITERKRLEIELKTKTVFLENVTENMFDLVSLTDLEGNFIFVGKSHEILGYKPFDLTGSNVMELVHPEDYQHVEKEFNNFLSSKENKKVEYRYRCSDGSYLWFETLGKILTDEDGEPEQIIFSTRDITERKQTEETLFVKTMALESSMNAIAIADMKGALIYVNPSFIKMWGYQEKKDIIGMQSTAFWESKKEAEQVKRAVVENQKWIGELKAKRKDGHLFDTQLSASIILNDSNEPQGMLASFLDITERKQAEQDLRESQERFQILHNASFGGISIHDKGVILDCNQGLSDITGFSYDELVGMDGLLLIASDWRDFVSDKITSGYEDPYEAEGIRKDKSIYPVRLHGKKISYKGKQVRVVEFRDISEQKKIEEQQILLNTTSNEMLKIDVRQKLYDYIATQLHSIYPEAYVIYLSVNETKNKVRIESIKGLEDGLLYRIATIFGYKLLGKEYEIDDRMNSVFYSDKLTYLKEGMVELSSNVLPSISARQVQKIAGIKETYAIGVLKDKQLIGAIHIFCRKPSELKNNSTFVESIIHQASIILHKNQLENQLRSSLKEKECLMKELNHRVKNNLAMVSSLISLKDSETSEDLSDLKHRIDVIKLVHEKLHKQKDIEQIEVKEYFHELLSAVFSSSTIIDVNVINNIEEMHIPTKMAMTLGLVVNEIATNAVKYSFTSEKEARFTIDMQWSFEDQVYVLKLSNTGNPFPEDISLNNPKTMGLQLVSALVSQLGGSIELQKQPFTLFTIRFPQGEL